MYRIVSYEVEVLGAAIQFEWLGK